MLQCFVKYIILVEEEEESVVSCNRMVMCGVRGKIPVPVREEVFKFFSVVDVLAFLPSALSSACLSSSLRLLFVA